MPRPFAGCATATKSGRVAITGSAPDVAAVRDGDAIHVDVDGQSLEFAVAPPPTVESAVAHAAAGDEGASVLTAPMPGRVIAVRAPRATVRAGEPVVVIEAMKMEHAVAAPIEGTRRARDGARGRAGRARRPWSPRSSPAIGILIGHDRDVRIYEVGPRDGLQNEAAPISTDAKLRFIDLLADAGLREIEATSFVSPRAVPQLADADELMARLERRPGVRYPVLVPNERGLERAEAAGADAVCVFTAASEAFTAHNINMTIAESIDAFRPVVARARERGWWTRGYVSTAFGCPY